MQIRKLAMKRIFLTAGHHNRDSGAIGNGFQENKLTIEFRNLVTARIKDLCPSIVVWNDDDNDTLAQVIAKINKVATADDYLLEIHFDSAENLTATGTTSLVATNARGKSLNFASLIAKITSETIGIRNRGVKTEAESNRGKLGVLHTKASSVLAEVCFISNKNDIEKYHHVKHLLAEQYAFAIISTLDPSLK